MNTWLLPLFLFFAIPASAQQLQCKAADAATNKPLPYATILFNHQKDVIYSDSSGNFILDKDSLPADDSICIEYLGFVKLCISNNSLNANNVFLLTSESNELNPVTVSNCTKFKNYLVNKRTGRIDNYLGPGPETKIIIIGRYANNKNAAGYVKQIEFYAGSFNKEAKVPVRLRWYEWDSVNQIPGKELTSTNIIFYLYKEGWNSFGIPSGTIYFPESGIVMGLEFIYPVEFVYEYAGLTTVKQKAAWLMQMGHRWSLGMQTIKDEMQCGFYITNNEPVRQYNSRGKGYYIKPAIKFTVAVCEK